jgi:hypothetical protein
VITSDSAPIDSETLAREAGEHQVAAFEERRARAEEAAQRRQQRQRQRDEKQQQDSDVSFEGEGLSAMAMAFAMAGADADLLVEADKPRAESTEPATEVDGPVEDAPEAPATPVSEQEMTPGNMAPEPGASGAEGRDQVSDVDSDKPDATPSGSDQ